MNAATPLEPEIDAPFSGMTLTASSHFSLALLGVVAHLIEACTDDDVGAALQAHPFLGDYYVELTRHIGTDVPLADGWREALHAWVANDAAGLPIRELRSAGLSALELELLLAVGLVEEDPRFGALFEQGPSRERRPTLLMLLAWWRSDEHEGDRLDRVRDSVYSLVRAGLLQVMNPDAPRPEWTFTVPSAIWDVVRGNALALPWLKHIAPSALLPLSSYIAPDEKGSAGAAPLVQLLRSEPCHLIVLRGSSHNGRATFAGGVAHALGKSLLIIGESALEDEARWRLACVMAVMLAAVPVVTLALGASEQRVLPLTPFYRGPMFVTTGLFGAISSANDSPAITLHLPLPGASRRCLHWQEALPAHEDARLKELAARFRLGSGTIRRVAASACSVAQLEGRAVVEAHDVRRAMTTLRVDGLETLAMRVPASGAWTDLVVDDPTRAELDALLIRCRFREELAERAPDFARENVGVRALLAGPSGTGKTLAACLLSAELGKELYRIDLAATVNKYIGETEKNLHRAFSAAEELDVVLLLDEGDALMGKRTEVGSSNDRYANLETNFLLQRIESFTGILLVTSNAAEQIDKAFSRRMDVVVPFRVPDEYRRYEILQRHLGESDLEAQWLEEVACRCALTGGQLRNVVGHARLLAMQDDSPICTEHLHAALSREYRKTGAACPLRAPASKRM